MMTSNPSIQSRVQRLLDEMLSLVDQYEQAVKDDAFFSVKKELRNKINAIQKEINNLSQLSGGEQISNKQLS